MSSIKLDGFEVLNSPFSVNPGIKSSCESQDIYDLDLCTVNMQPPLARQVTTGYSCHNTDCNCHQTQNNCYGTQNSCNQTNCC